MERPQFLNEQLINQYRYLDSGRRSDAYQTDHRVIKIVRVIPSHHTVESFARHLKWQYDLISQYLDEYVVPTNIVVGPTETINTEGQTERQSVPAISIVQPFIEGITLDEALTQRHANFGQVRDLLNRCLHMREETGYIPDVFGGFHPLHGGYQPRRTKNLKIAEEEGMYRPYLVDTNFGRHSTRTAGILIRNPLLAHAIKNLLRDM